MEKGSSLAIGPAQFRGLLAILQWWAFNVLVIITNKWIFQVRVQKILSDNFLEFFSYSLDQLRIYIFFLP
jgi:hypothetical protein